MAETFVARERELKRLETLLGQALAGQGQLGFVTGEAGAGKTALLREFTRRAQQEHPELVAASGDCNDLGSHADPYLPFREVLAQLVGDVEKALAQGAISPDGADRLKRLLARSSQVLVDIAPDLINIVIPGSRLVALFAKSMASRAGLLAQLDGLAHARQAPTSIGAPSLTPEHIYDEYTAFLRRLSESQPLLIILDDLHWIDSASAGLLFHLSRRIGDRRILILGAYRPDVVARGRDGNRHPLEPVLNEVKRYSGQGSIDLAPSTTQEARAFVDAVLDAEPNHLDDHFRQTLCERTEGHPIFLTELLRTMRERGDLFQDPEGQWTVRPGIEETALPERVDGVLAERMARLTPEELALLQAASVEGDHFIAEVVARVTHRDPRQVVTTLSMDLDRGHALVTGAGVRRIGEQRVSSYSFRHNLVRQYLYQSMDEAQRAYLHEDLAHALIDLYGDEDAEIIGQLAWHFRLAGVADRAFHYSVLAGDRAGAVYANADAVVNYSSAIELLHPEVAEGDVIHLYRARGRAYELSGDPDTALANYEAMRALGRERGSTAIEVAALAAQATLLAIPTGKHNVVGAQRLATEALEMARATGNAAAEAQILWSLLLIHMFSGQYAEAVAYGEQSETLARQLDLQEQLAFTLNDLDHAYGMAGERDKALAAGAEARRLWEQLGNQPMLANATSREAVWSFFAGDLDPAKQTAGKAVRIGRSIGNLSALSLGQTVVGLVSFEQGDGRATREALQEAVESGRRGNNTLATTGVRAELAWVMACSGRFAEALTAAQEALEESDRDYRPAHEWTAAILVRIHLLRGDVSAAETAFARAALEGVEDRLDQTPIFGGAAIGLAVMELAQARGDFAGSLLAADRLIAHLDRIGAQIYLQDVQLLRGKALLALDRRDEARSALEQARHVAEAAGSHRILWMIIDAQADLEQLAGNSAQASDRRRLSRQEIEKVADGLADEGLRSEFMRSPRVTALFAKNP